MQYIPRLFVCGFQWFIKMHFQRCDGKPYTTKSIPAVPQRKNAPGFGNQGRFVSLAKICFQSDGGQNLQPVLIGVSDEIQTHGGVFVADAAHFGMLGMGGLEIIHTEGQMEFVVT